MKKKVEEEEEEEGGEEIIPSNGKSKWKLSKKDMDVSVEAKSNRFDETLDNINLNSTTRVLLMG